MDTPIFYLFLFLHLVSLMVGFGSVVVIDSFGLLWLLKIRGISLSFVTKVARVTQVLIWLGFSGLVVSGIPMLYLKGSVDNLTKFKLFLVVMVGLNGVFLHFIKRAMEKAGMQDKVSPLIQFRISLASTISQAGWWGAIVIGFLHRHISHNIPGYGFWWIIALAAAILILLTVLIGEKSLKNK